MKTYLNNIALTLDQLLPYEVVGKVLSTRGQVYETYLPQATVGSRVLFSADNNEKVEGEVVSIKEKLCYCIPYFEITGINSNTKIFLKNMDNKIKLCPELLGRVVDCSGIPIDKGPSLESLAEEERSIYGVAMNPLDRVSISEPMYTGIKSIDSFLTLGKGQRIAIMAGSGVGKSVLMGMIARNTHATVNVIALIGERGREVLDFIKDDLGDEGLKNSVIVTATSDTSPLMRIKAAYTATTIAEYFRDLGHDVMFMMDSVTRFAMACREVSMNVGEPPGPKGYGPSVFAKLPKLLERMGTKKEAGSITGIYTVLVEGGDFDEPIVDSIRSIADGHIVLSRELASRNFYPAIEVLQSVSRVMNKVAKREHQVLSGHLRDLMSIYNQSEDLINLGAYVKGANIKLDKAVAIKDDMDKFLKQDYDEKSDYESLFDLMVEIARKGERSVNPELFNETDQ
ncbi:MAG: FliI/YscN family ATPase [Bacteriovoracaceae bacterium]|nr:FliI/YscN family ATPase [Bacteriovoracaceae bacterium]